MRTLMTAMLLCLPALAQTPKPAPAPKTTAATVGKAAPAFRANDDTGALVQFGGGKRRDGGNPGKVWTVLAFYPKASTGG